MNPVRYAPILAILFCVCGMSHGDTIESLSQTNAAHGRWEAKSGGTQLLNPRHAGKLFIGMSLKEVHKAYPKALMKWADLQGPDGVPSHVLQIFLNKAQEDPSLVLTFDGEDKLTYMAVYDPQFRTTANIGVGSTLGQLRKAYYGSFSLIGSDPLHADIHILNMSFDLKARLYDFGIDRLKGSDDPRIPDTVTIKMIEVWGIL
jgi:hypothetical protein